jgi:hypothetical protein
MNILDFIERGGKRRQVFADEQFSRQTIEGKLDNTILKITCDTLSEGDLIFMQNFIRIDGSAKKVKLTIPGKTLCNFDDELGLIIKDSEDLLVWIPIKPAVRVYDKNKRMLSEVPADYTIDESDGIQLTFSCKNEGIVEFPIIVTNNKQLEKEIQNKIVCEKRRYIVTDWFAASTINQYWEYMINGSFYDPRFKTRKFFTFERRFKCQQCAFAWYNLLDYLEKKSEKKIYELLKRQLSYSVMLDLDSEGKWRHGVFTDDMEIHTRFQSDGISLLLDYYRESKNKIFLEKAEQAAATIIGMIDQTDFGPWFIHDSLEEKEEGHEYYKDALRFNSFGKNPSNLFVLNTHVQNLSMIFELAKTTLDPKYEKLFEDSMVITKKVLYNKPAETVYKLVLKLYSYKKDLLSKTKTRICRRVIRRLKKHYPRLSLPTGFIDRDLDCSHLNEFYFLVNLKDLLLLYHQTGEKWILDEVKDGISIAKDKRFYENLRDMLKDVHMVTDIYVMYSPMDEKIDFEGFAQAAIWIYEKFDGISLESVSSDWIKSYYKCFTDVQIEKEKILPFIMGKKQNPILVLVNPTIERKQVYVEFVKDDKKIPVTVDSKEYSLIDISKKASIQR